MTPINLPSCLRNSATESGVDFFGIADLDGFVADFKEIWPLPLNGLHCGISIGIALNRWVVDRISETRDMLTGKLYWQQCYTVVNERLDWIAVWLAAQLEKGGFRAVPVPATVKVDSEGLLGPMTHKAVASRYDVHKCKSYLASVPVCGLCLASCPHGQEAPRADRDRDAHC